MDDDRDPPALRERIRWANVAKAVAVAGLIVLVVAWPRLSSDGPALPEEVAPRPAPTLAVEPAPVDEPPPPAADPPAKKERRRRGRSGSVPRRGNGGRRRARRGERRGGVGAARPRRRPFLLRSVPVPAPGARSLPPRRRRARTPTARSSSPA